MYLDDTPKGISCLNHLVVFLICKGFLLKKIIIIPKEQAPKLHGDIANVPADANKTFTLLPSTENITMVKLKKNISFKGHIFLSQLDQKKYLKH